MDKMDWFESWEDGIRFGAVGVIGDAQRRLAGGRR